ncbi:MAG TPA: endopeptidase, partial [Myxococcota bacterium]|nr:endopeptidase [Myxococcota bacterium]
LVDAHDGEVLALQDINHYLAEQITGGVYPLTSTEICPDATHCGTMQTGWPMPFADTGLASPNDFTNSAGLFDSTGGTVTTTLTGQYVDIVDSCGAPGGSASGSLNLGGANGQHDCTTPGGLAGNTAAARSAFYEVNKLAEMARGWLPSNAWLQNRLTTNVNIALTCNAFWNGSTINFYRSGGGCRNTGEIAAVFDHEWGHGLDDNDAVGTLSSSSEGYADIAGIYRLQASCVGHGFFWTANSGCGQTADGTGFNQNEAQQGASHCNTDCSGVRDADWAKRADNTPDTPLGFVCTSCLTGSGPCGRQVHCAAAPSRQAAWDLVARDLRGAPFNLDSQTAFLIGNKLFYQGSGNIGAWHACTCGSSSSGCGATNAYMQWLAADDDNGNLNDGTPHMTALFNAFNRHGIACATPAAVNSGCASGPSAAP